MMELVRRYPKSPPTRAGTRRSSVNKRKSNKRIDQTKMKRLKQAGLLPIKNTTERNTETRTRQSKEENMTLWQTSKETQILPDGTHITKENKTTQSRVRKGSLNVSTKTRSVKKKAMQKYLQCLLKPSYADGIATPPMKPPVLSLEQIVADEMMHLRTYPFSRQRTRRDFMRLMDVLPDSLGVKKILLAWFRDFCEWIPFYFFEDQRNNAAFFQSQQCNSKERPTYASVEPVHKDATVYAVDFKRMPSSSSVLISSAICVQTMSNWNKATLKALKRGKWDYFKLIEEMDPNKVTRLKMKHEHFSLFLEEWEFMRERFCTESRSRVNIIQELAQGYMFRKAASNGDIRAKDLVLPGSQIINPYLHPDTVMFSLMESYFFQTHNPLTKAQNVTFAAPRIRCVGINARINDVTYTTWLPVGFIQQNNQAAFRLMCGRMQKWYKRHPNWRLMHQLGSKEQKNTQTELMTRFKDVMKCEMMFAFSKSSLARYNALL